MTIGYDDLCVIDVADESKRLVSKSTLIVRVDIQASSENTGTIYIGGSQVSSFAGLFKGTALAPNDIKTLHNVDLHEWWAVGATLNDYIYWGAEIEE